MKSGVTGDVVLLTKSLEKKRKINVSSLNSTLSLMVLTAYILKVLHIDKP